MRLGVYADLLYRRDETGISASPSFASWLLALATEVEELALFGRVQPVPGRAAYEVRGDNVRFVALPYYESLHRPVQLLVASVASFRQVRGELHRLDAMLLFGPHPLAVLFGLQARMARVPVVVGVRQDFPRYVANRLPRRTALWARPSAWMLEKAHRSMTRWGGAVAVGGELGERYARCRRPVLITGISLIRQHRYESRPAVGPAPWPGERRVLAVGRLDPEKNPFLLLDVLIALRRCAPWTLAAAGSGSLERELRQRVHAAHLQDVFFVLGQVDGPELDELYRRATVFVHVSWTEGQPQVLFEAAAARVPIVATAVGGVPEALAHGSRGLLVPPGKAEAIASAVARLDREPRLRQTIVERAWEWAQVETLDRQVRRVARFIEALAQGPSGARGSAVTDPPPD